MRKSNNPKSVASASWLKRNARFLIIIGALALLEGLLFLFYGGGLDKILYRINPATVPPQGIILFEGQDCDNCAKVDTFLDANNVSQTVPFTRLEVYYSQANANILADKAQACGLSPSEVGVPMLWDGSACVVGYVDIIQFFQRAMVKKSAGR